MTDLHIPQRGGLDMSQFTLPPQFTVTPGRSLFLGHDPEDNGSLCWTTSLRDSLAVIAPSGYGKTSGVIIPNMLAWDGPAVSTSTRGDVLAFTGNQRRRIAASKGGRTYVYDPLGSEPGVTSMGWSPMSGCDDPRVCYRRVKAIVGGHEDGVANSKHWKRGAAAIMRAYFSAAALTGEPMSTVRRWIARQEVEEPVEILRTDPRGVEMWADDLEAMPLLGERERASFFSFCRGALEATAEPTVLASCDVPTLDVDEFLATKSTLYVVGPPHFQDDTAPLIVGLIDSITQRGTELAARSPRGVLEDPLLLALDEVANIAPLPSLPTLVSESGGRGLVTLWAVQTLAGMRVRYGADQTQAILSATTTKLIYGGMSSDVDLRNVSGWAGERREHQVTLYAGADPRLTMQQAQISGEFHGRQHAIGYQYRPVLPVQAIQQLPPFHAWMWYRSDAPIVLQTPPAGLVDAYRPISGNTSDPELEAVAP